MTDWELVTPASENTPGKVRPVKTYKLTPGMAYVYNEGDLHAPRRSGPTRLIRLEGVNMEKVRRLRYKPVYVPVTPFPSPSGRGGSGPMVRAQRG